MKKTVVAFGEILWDIMPGATVLGGAPFNFINRIHALGDRGIMISRLGRDDLGRRTFDIIESQELETTALQWDDSLPTGTVNVKLDANGSPDFFIVPDVAYDAIAMTDAMIEIVRRSDCFCFGTLVQRAEKARETLYSLLEYTESSITFLDINLRKHCYSRETVDYSMRKADILKLNDDEVAVLSEMLSLSSADIPGFCREVTETFSIRACLVTLGSEGVFVYSAEDGNGYIPGYKVDVADTVGSGDAFSAGFIHAYLRGEPIFDAAAFGNALGALTATKQGGTAPVAPSSLECLLADANHPRIIKKALQHFNVA